MLPISPSSPFVLMASDTQTISIVKKSLHGITSTLDRLAFKRHQSKSLDLPVVVVASNFALLLGIVFVALFSDSCTIFSRPRGR